ncbi:MAG: hypothetical protein ACOYML_01865 [Microthrixaceae bacterium]
MGTPEATDGRDHPGDPVKGSDRAAAFAWAAAQRTARDSLARSLAEGTASLREVVGRACDEPWGSATLLFVLESLPAARKVDTRRALRRLGLDGDVSVCDLDAAACDVVLREFPLPTGPDVPGGGVAS